MLNDSHSQILDKLFRLIDVDSVNQVSTNQIMEFISNITNARPKSGFDKGALERLEQLFKKTVGDDKEIRREDFNKICLSKNVRFSINQLAMPLKPSNLL